MKLLDAKQMCEAMMSQHIKAEGWTFKWQNSVHKFGTCSSARRTITLSKPLVQMNNAERVKRVVIHEIAHALAGAKAGHGRKWKAQCLAIGGDGIRCWDESDTNPVPPKYIGTCPSGHTSRAYRKKRTKTSCGKCSPKFDERYLITYRAVVQ